jgi:CheY-like chemotaxis protein/glycine cleavage system H lipoate-binding protein
MSAEILLVDDEIGICKSCSMLLRRSGYDVEYVLNAEEGLKKFQEGNHLLVITDMKMPGMDGMEFMRRIKAQNATVNIIMITGYATVKSALEAVKIGAFDYIPKPYPPHELTAIVKRAIEDTKVKRQAQQPGKPEAPPAPPPRPPLDGLASEVARKIWCIKGHSWVRVFEDAKRAEIGMDALFGRSLRGKIVSLKFPELGDELQQGFPFCQVTVQNDGDTTVYSIKSPVSGFVKARNVELETYPERIRGDYYQSWLVRVELLSWDEDSKTLMSFDELQTSWMELQVAW